MASDTPGLPVGGGIHAPLALRCVVREPCVISLKIIVLVFQTSPQLLLSRKCAMAILGPMSPSLVTESPSGLKFGNWLIWYSLSKPATIHHRMPASRSTN
ncbi:hypothetical protein M405DRAFT_833714 [Rhizopogon salebrosus TDB-379]|nr:hypothetical protein M405DRAFT_833714 [Rhizopogon salebrosus TDB-379]